MKSKTIAIALTLVASAASGLAQAQADYSVSLRLDGFDALRTGPTYDPVHGTTIFPPNNPATHGTWGSGIAHQNISVQSQAGAAEFSGVQDTDLSPSGLIVPDAELHSTLFTNAHQDGISTSAQITSTGPLVSAALPAAGGHVESSAKWGLYFNVDPHSSLTLSATSLFSASGLHSVFPALIPSSNFNSNASSLAMSFSDTAGQFRNGFQVDLDSSLASYAGVLSYSIDDAAHSMSFTIKNDGNDALNAHLNAFSALNINLAAAAPVPEPAAISTLLLGLGVLGAMARRRQKKQA